jgi:hypothetical protein
MKGKFKYGRFPAKHEPGTHPDSLNMMIVYLAPIPPAGHRTIILTKEQEDNRIESRM